MYTISTSTALQKTCRSAQVCQFECPGIEELSEWYWRDLDVESSIGSIVLQWSFISQKCDLGI